MAPRIEPPRARQAGLVEHAFAGAEPDLLAGLDRPQQGLTRRCIVRPDAARAHPGHRGAERQQPGADITQIGIVLVEQRPGGQHHAARRQRCVRRIERAQAEAAQLVHPLAHRRVVEQEHLLDQAVQLAQGRTVPRTHGQMARQVPLRTAMQGREPAQPEFLGGGKEADRLALDQHRSLCLRAGRTTRGRRGARSFVGSSRCILARDRVTNATRVTDSQSRPRNAGITASATHWNCSSITAFGVPMLVLRLMVSSPGNRSCIPCRCSTSCAGVPANQAPSFM